MKSLVLSLAALSLCGFSAAADPVHVVAAENFYGDLAQQIGGAHVQVTSILTNPDQDPHLFEASPATARAIAAADVVIANGADYDPWMQKLIAATTAPGAQGDRRRRADRRQARRQSASLVCAGQHEGGRQSARPGARCRRPRAR